MDEKALVEQYLSETILMQVATVSGDRPWVCTVHFAYDTPWQFYWLSRPARRHSKELIANQNVAGVIVRAHTVGEDVMGLQFEGEAKVAAKEDLERGKVVYRERYGFDSAGEHELYVVKPQRLVLFDSVHLPESPQREIVL